MKFWRGILAASAALCAGSLAAQTVTTDLALHSHRLTEDFLSSTHLSEDGMWALRTVADGPQTLFRLRAGATLNDPPGVELDQVERAVFCGAGLLELSKRGDSPHWLWQRLGEPLSAPHKVDALGTQAAALPPEANPICTPDARTIVYYTVGKVSPQGIARTELWIPGPKARARLSIDAVVTHAVFSHNGSRLYALGRRQDGSSTLYGVAIPTRKVTKLAEHLDATPFPGHTLAVTPGDDAVLIPLAGMKAPASAERQKADAGRWLQLYRFELRTAHLQVFQGHEGEDELDPAFVGGALYWVDSRIARGVGIVPATGGAIRVLAARDAHRPTWAPDSRRLALVSGQYRVADVPLDLHIALIDVDDSGRPNSLPRNLMIGDPDFPPLVQLEPTPEHPRAEPAWTVSASIPNPVSVEWSPQRDRLAIEAVVSPKEHALWVVSADGSRPQKLLSFPSDTPGGLSWQPDGTELVFAAFANGRMQLFTVPASGGGPRPLTDGTGNYLHPRVSPDGRWVAFERIDTVATLQHRCPF